jgi:hypothetical protein
VRPEGIEVIEVRDLSDAIGFVFASERGTGGVPTPPVLTVRRGEEGR